MYAGVDTARFLGMWFVDSSHRNTVTRVLPGRGKIVKHWPVGGYKRFEDHYLSVYLSNTYWTYKRLFGTPIAFSVMCSLWKIGPICLDLLQTSCELMMKGDFKLWWFPDRLHSLTNTNSHFLDLEKVISFVWYTQRLSQTSCVSLNKRRIFGAALFDCPSPKHLVWIRHCIQYMLFSAIGNKHVLRMWTRFDRRSRSNFYFNEKPTLLFAFSNFSSFFFKKYFVVG